jgi:electron transfer flavoprotein beta subunit
MKIVVCVKQVPNTQTVLMDRLTNTLIREGVEAVINAYDFFALEEALRLREAQGGTITTLSMGIPRAIEALRQTIALGADDAILLSEKTFAGSDTLATAYALSCGIKKIGSVDLILCGKQSSDGDTGQTGPSLAEKLNFSHITQVRKIREVSTTHLVVERATDDGYDVVQVKLPAVLSVVKELNEPRTTSIRGRMKALNYTPIIWNAADIYADPSHCGLAGSPTLVEKTFIPETETIIEMLDGTTNEKVLALVEKISSLRHPAS